MINDLFEYFDKPKFYWKMLQTNCSDVNILQKLKVNVLISVFSGHPCASCKWGPWLKDQGCKNMPCQDYWRETKEELQQWWMEMNKRKMKKLQVNSAAIYILEQSVNT